VQEYTKAGICSVWRVFSKTNGVLKGRCGTIKANGVPLRQMWALKGKWGAIKANVGTKKQWGAIKANVGAKRQMGRH
jgi:hypothetical protein